MTFIPDPNKLAVGDRVALTKEVSTHLGTFTVGHEFKLLRLGDRGWDMIDDEGRKICEAGFGDSFLTKV